MTGAFIVNRRAAILRVLLVLAITFTLGFAAGRVSAAPRPASNVIPATPATAGESDSSGLTGALLDLHAVSGDDRLRGQSVPRILGGAPPSRIIVPGPRIGRLVRPGDKSPTVTGGVLRGTASFYDDGSGLYAAAGPALRVGNWRGRLVSVCTARACVAVRLTDFCGCYGTRLIDLSRDAFARLAPTSAGLVQVTIRWWR